MRPQTAIGRGPTSQAQALVKSDDLDQLPAEVLQVDHPGYGTRSILESSANLVNATVGAGILGLPFALLAAGFWMGLGLSVLVAALTQLAMIMMVVAAKRKGIYTLSGISELIMGPAGFYLMNFMLFLQSAGSVVSYYIIVGDTIPIVLGLYWPQYAFLASRQVVVLVLSTVIIFPLILQRSMGAMSSISMLGVVLLPLIILTILIRAPTYISEHDAPLTFIGANVFPSIGIMAFAFVCSQVAYPTFLATENQTTKGWTLVCNISTSTSWVISMVFAVVGYLSFGTSLEPNLFNNFPQNDAIINAGRVMMAIMILLTIPMGFFPAREALQKTLGQSTCTRSPTNAEHYVLSIIFHLITVGLGMHLTTLGKVYALVGGLASTYLAYIVPSLSWLVVFRPKWLRPFHMGWKGPVEAHTHGIVDYSSDHDRAPQATEHDPLLPANHQAPLPHHFETVIWHPKDVAGSRVWDAFAVFMVAFGLVVMVVATITNVQNLSM